MNKTKNKINLSPIVGMKANENWTYNSPNKPQHGILESKVTNVLNEVHATLTNQDKNFKTAGSIKLRSFDAALNSGQREFAKKNSRRSHYITKK